MECTAQCIAFLMLCVIVVEIFLHVCVCACMSLRMFKKLTCASACVSELKWRIPPLPHPCFILCCSLVFLLSPMRRLPPITHFLSSPLPYCSSHPDLACFFWPTVPLPCISSVLCGQAISLSPMVFNSHNCCCEETFFVCLFVCTALWPEAVL